MAELHDYDPLETLELPEKCQRRETEPTKAYAALMDYMRMGYGRSLAKLSTRYQSVPKAASQLQQPPTRRLTSLREWSAQWEWVERSIAWDEWQEELRNNKWNRRRQELQDLDWELGIRLRQRAEELLMESGRFMRRKEQMITDPETGERMKVVILAMNATPAQIATMAKTASDLQRLSVNVPTTIIGLEGAALDAAIASELAKLADRAKAQSPGSFAQPQQSTAVVTRSPG